MGMFFYICDYLCITPEEFFRAETADPVRLRELCEKMQRLNSHQLELLEQLVLEMR